MFKGAYQKKLLSILYSGGSTPLEIWDIQVKNGWTRRVKDEDLGSIVFEICGTNVATAYIISPPDPRTVLGITLPFITMFIKNLKRYFTFEIQILDDKQMRRRFRFSNYQSSTKVRPFTCSVPLALKPGWNQMQLNLANFTTRAYGTNYMETQRVQIHANCRIRRVYFSDRLYSEEELPRDYRIYLNMRQVAQQEAKDEQTDHPSQMSHPLSTVKQPSKATIEAAQSVLMTRTSMTRSTSADMMVGTKLEEKSSVHSTVEGEEPRRSAHSMGSRKSLKSLTKLEERMSMSAIAEEKEGEGGEGGGGGGGEEGVEGEAFEGGLEAQPELGEGGDVESPEESPRIEDEEMPTTEGESPRTEETESPRSDMPESEVAESEPIPESDVEAAEAAAEEAAAEEAAAEEAAAEEAAPPAEDAPPESEEPPTE